MRGYSCRSPCHNNCLIKSNQGGSMATYNPVLHGFPKSIASDYCESLIYFFPMSANLKCAKTFKYLISNNINSDFWGLTESQIQGLTIEELAIIEQHRVLRRNHLCNIENLDSLVLASKSTQVLPECDVLTRSGLIMRHDIIKVPVIGKNNNVISIFSFTNERTDTVNLHELLDLYTSEYVNKKVAVSHMLKHLDWSRFFIHEPSYSELRVLLSIFYHGEDRGYVALRLNKSFKTIQKHIDGLKDKLRPHESFKKMVSTLRLAV